MLSRPNLSSPDDRAQLVAFRRLYFGFAAVAMLLAVVMHSSYSRFAFEAGATVPYGPWSLASPLVHVILGLGAAGSLLLVALRPRCWAPLIALAFTLAYFHDVNWLRSIGVVNRVGRETCLMIALLALYLLQPRGPVECGWFLRALRAAVIFPYFSSGLAKLLHGGADWWTGQILAQGFADWAVAGGSVWSLWMANHAGLCAVLAVVSLVVDLASPAVLIFEGFGAALALYAVGFHLMTLWLMGPNFLHFFLPAFLVFLLPTRPFAAIVSRVAAAESDAA